MGDTGFNYYSEGIFIIFMIHTLKLFFSRTENSGQMAILRGNSKLFSLRFMKYDCDFRITCILKVSRHTTFFLNDFSIGPYFIYDMT